MWPIHAMGADALVIPATVQVPATTLPLPTPAAWKALTPEGKKNLAIYAVVGGVVGYAILEEAGAVVGALGGAVTALYRMQAAAAVVPAAPVLVAPTQPAGLPPAPVVTTGGEPKQIPGGDAPLNADGTPAWVS